MLLRNITRFILNRYVVSSLVCGLILGCSEDDDLEANTDSDNQVSTDSAENPSDSDEGRGELVVADAMTHATPQVDEALLTADHDGWADANCLQCHDTLHTSGYKSVSHCATCHGANGAPLLPEGHKWETCLDCHGDRHSDVDLEKDEQCLSCHVAYNSEALPPCSHTGDYDVIIVGAGGGGLAAATTLVKEGKSVLVLEKHYQTGGAMVTFQRGDYTFEASLHAFDGMSIGHLKKLGIQDQVEMSEGEYMYRSIYPEFTIDVPADAQAYEEALGELFPDYAEQLKSLFALLTSMNFFEYMDKSVMDLMDDYGIDDIKIITTLTQLVGFIGAAPENINASIYIGMWAMFHNYGYLYPIGGSQAITDALTASIVNGGGEIYLNTLVTRINIEDGLATGVETANGGCYTADYVISNANQPDTYLKLVGAEHLPEDVVNDMAEKKYAPPVSLVYLGVDHDYTEFFPGGSHEIWVNRRYADEWFSPGPHCDAEKALSIANYSALDPLAAPSGKNVVALTFLIDYACDNEWRLGSSYEEYKQYKANLAEYYIAVAEDYLPELSKHVEVVEIASPSTVQRYTLNPEGSWAGWDLEFETTPLTMFTTEKHLTPIPNLYQAGSWATTGGQSVVLQSGMMAAELVLQAMK